MAPGAGGYLECMNREPHEDEPDDLDALAAEAGQSLVLVAMTALIVVLAMVLGFAI
jgi:hypothetical protein